MQTCYAKWLIICSGYYEFNALVHVHCVEWNCHYFLLFICRILACMCRLLVLPYHMANKDEYINYSNLIITLQNIDFCRSFRRLARKGRANERTELHGGHCSRLSGGMFIPLSGQRAPANYVTHY